MKWMDMHCDTVSELFRKRSEGTLWKNKLCVDIERLKKSDSVAQFFACYANAAEYPGWEEAFDAAEKLIQSVHEEEAKEFCVAGSGAELEAAEQAKKYAGILTVEEGGVLNGKAERVEQLYEQGVRLLTLTWNYENCIGSPNSRDTEVMQRGLKPFGIEVVRRMNELGMLVDVSHLSDGGFWDCIRYSTDPIVASHSNCRELCRHPRNLTDEMLRAVGEKGGVVGLNFDSAFLTEKKERAGLEMLAEHAKRMIRMAGEDAVALGTDFDGFERKDLPEKLEGAERIELVWDAFQKAGITSRQTEKIAYGNLFRVIEAGCGKTSVS